MFKFLKNIASGALGGAVQAGKAAFGLDDGIMQVATIGSLGPDVQSCISFLMSGGGRQSGEGRFKAGIEMYYTCFNEIYEFFLNPDIAVGGQNYYIGMLTLNQQTMGNNFCPPYYVDNSALVPPVPNDTWVNLPINVMQPTFFSQWSVNSVVYAKYQTIFFQHSLMSGYALSASESIIGFPLISSWIDRQCNGVLALAWSDINPSQQDWITFQQFLESYDSFGIQLLSAGVVSRSWTPTNDEMTTNWTEVEDAGLPLKFLLPDTPQDFAAPDITYIGHAWCCQRNMYQPSVFQAAAQQVCVICWQGKKVTSKAIQNMLQNSLPKLAWIAMNSKKALGYLNRDQKKILTKKKAAKIRALQMQMNPSSQQQQSNSNQDNTPFTDSYLAEDDSQFDVNWHDYVKQYTNEGNVNTTGQSKQKNKQGQLTEQLTINVQQKKL